jgi:hypothetical protein
VWPKKCPAGVDRTVPPGHRDPRDSCWVAWRHSPGQADGHWRRHSRRQFLAWLCELHACPGTRFSASRNPRACQRCSVAVDGVWAGCHQLIWTGADGCAARRTQRAVPATDRR